MITPVERAVREITGLTQQGRRRWMEITPLLIAETLQLAGLLAAPVDGELWVTCQVCDGRPGEDCPTCEHTGRLSVTTLWRHLWNAWRINDHDPADAVAVEDLRRDLIEVLDDQYPDCLDWTGPAVEAIFPIIAAHVAERERKLREEIERLRENRRQLLRRDAEQQQQISELIERGGA